MLNTFIDLFAGLGGFRIALHKEGLKCVFSSDIDERIRENYQHNFWDPIAGDIRKIDASAIPPHDILCAGFPCQSFSVSGKGRGFDDDRGQLFYEIVRIAKYHRPKIMLLENVRGIVRMDGGKTLQTIYREIEDLGYTLKHAVLNASNFNIPQGRIRTYFVAIRNDIPLVFTPPEPIKCTTYLKDILLTAEEISRIPPESVWPKDADADTIIINKPETPPEQGRLIQIGTINTPPGIKGYQGRRIYSENGHACTQMSNGGGGVGRNTGLYMIAGKVRRLYVVEGLRLQGFPDHWCVSAGSRGTGEVGNAVIPAMVSHIYKAIQQC